MKAILLVLCLAGCTQHVPEGSKCIQGYVYYQATKDVWLVLPSFAGAVPCAEPASAVSK